MPDSLDRRAVARRRIQKFMNRSGPDLGAPIVELRDEEGRIPLMTLNWERVGATDNWQIRGIETYRLDKRMVDSTIVECRVFCTEGEDSYVPKVVTSLQSLLTPEQARARRPLKEHVAQVV